ncbi:MAG: hypothetical protein JNM67_05460 [Bacteroidetes bacterium]|nr:hypothetical protein [Bacteroidota bacterium]
MTKPTPHYSPFGSLIPNRYWSDASRVYRYGFNGKEEDKEGVGGGGPSYDYGFRIYNPNLVKFLSVDPLFKQFVMLTPFQFSSNTPISAIDLDGLEAKLAIYGAGVARDTSGNVIERHEPQFKRESDKYVKQGTAVTSIGVHKCEELISVLENYTKSDSSIGLLIISSHSGSSGIILDNGQYGKEVIGIYEFKNYTFLNISQIASNPKIKFAPNALVIFTGCNAGRTVAIKDNKSPVLSVAKEFTKLSGTASIGAYGKTSPRGKNGCRKADYEYRLFYIDEYGTLQQVSLGKELTPEAIAKAQGIVDSVLKKKEEILKKANENNNDKNNSSIDTTGTN